jgi:hypothetical protein
LPSAFCLTSYALPPLSGASWGNVARFLSLSVALVVGLRDFLEIEAVNRSASLGVLN